MEWMARNNNQHKYDYEMYTWILQYKKYRKLNSTNTTQSRVLTYASYNSGWPGCWMQLLCVTYKQSLCWQDTYEMHSFSHGLLLLNFTTAKGNNINDGCYEHYHYYGKALMWDKPGSWGWLGSMLSHYDLAGLSVMARKSLFLPHLQFQPTLWEKGNIIIILFFYFIAFQWFADTV